MPQMGQWRLLLAGAQTPRHMACCPAISQRRAGVAHHGSGFLTAGGAHTSPRQAWAHGTHLAAAEDVCTGDTHVEMLEHGLRLLLGFEGTVH